MQFVHKSQGEVRLSRAEKVRVTQYQMHHQLNKKLYGIRFHSARKNFNLGLPFSWCTIGERFSQTANCRLFLL